MARIVNFCKTLRNNWKKTTLAATVLVYGIDYAETEFRKKTLVKRYCQEAVKYGDIPLDILQSPRHVVVLLNPAANKKKAQKEYEKYCAPLLHLAGIMVTVLTTNKNMDSISIVNDIPSNAEAVLIAGGNGMVTDVITGLMRLRNDQSIDRIPPVGIIPIGRTNTFANKLYSYDITTENDLYRIFVMMEATFSIIKELTTKLNVMEIKNMDKNDNTDTNAKMKPIYAVNALEFGAFRNAYAAKDKYWYFGRLRSYASYVLGFFNPDSPIKANINYTLPCSGCSKCYWNRNVLTKKKEEITNRRWWHPFVPTFRRNLDQLNNGNVDYSQIKNPQCGEEREISVNTVELNISPQVNGDIAGLHVDIGPEKLSYIKFIKEGWRRENQDDRSTMRDEVEIKKFDAQELHFTPLKDKMNEEFFSIDNEEFEVKEMSVSLLHNIMSVFWSPSRNLNDVLL